MYTLDTISNSVKFSGNMMIIVSESVLLTLNALKVAGRSSASVQDVTYVINSQVKASWNKVTEEQVTRVMKKMARDIEKGYKYRGFRCNLKNLDGYFFSI
jgi:hypothetical protein